MLLAGNPLPISGLVSTQRIALRLWIHNSGRGKLLRALARFAYFARHCHALSAIVGILRRRVLPSFLGIGIERNFWCFQLLLLALSSSLRASLSSNVSEAFPSIPAVFLPAFSWVTWRIANILAAVDFRISFWRDFALGLSPTWIALYTRFCRRNKLRRNFFHGNVFQDSRFVAVVSNHALL
jgi:hypothetical protein